MPNPSNDPHSPIVPDADLLALASELATSIAGYVPLSVLPPGQPCKLDRSIVEALRVGGFLNPQADISAANILVAEKTRWLVKAMAEEKERSHVTTELLIRHVRKGAIQGPALAYAEARLKQSAEKFHDLSDNLSA